MLLGGRHHAASHDNKGERNELHSSNESCREMEVGGGSG